MVRAWAHNRADLARLYGLIGKHIDRLRICTGDIHIGETYDHGCVTVITDGVAGLYTDMESIVMFGENSRMCCAFIDQGVVRYFSNRRDWIDQLPAEVETWRARFAHKEIVFEIFKLDEEM